MVYTLVWDKMSESEQALSQSVQGILNRKGRKIFIDADNYKSYLKEDYEETDIWELIKANAQEFTGAVSYKLSCDDVGINMAATVSAAYDLLGVPEELIGKVNLLGIKTVKNLDEIKGSSAERQRAVFNAVKDKLSKTALVHQVVKAGNFHLMLRDFSIANRWACIYTGENAADRSFRKEVLEWLDGNVPVYGWNDDEIAFIRDISEYGNYAVPTDWSCNHSFFGYGGHTVKQITTRTEINEKNKHFVAIVVSDGDNVQWLEREFATKSLFGQRQRSKLNYKMNWTFSPSLVKLNSAAAENIYSGNKNDYFISGVSGVGYANCLSYPRERLDGFTESTAKAMADSDLSVLCLLDYLPLTEDADFVKDRLSSYTRFDNISGGVWELDPDHYRGGQGKIFFSEGKPFISVRLSLWHPSDRPGNVTREWLDEFTEKFNSLTVDPYSENGYTVLNVHPWTITMDDLDYVVSKFDKKFELVYADELIELVKKNLG